MPAYAEAHYVQGGGVNGTILDAKGRPARDREYCERQGEKLIASFRNCLRRGDVYAKYSDGQYLVLCAGARRENISGIGARIDTDFRKRSGGRGGINCRFLEDETVWQGKNEIMSGDI